MLAINSWKYPVLQLVQEVLPSLSWYVPTWQAIHARAVELGWFFPYWQAIQDDIPARPWNLPALQSLQLFILCKPGRSPNFPAMHSLHKVQEWTPFSLLYRPGLQSWHAEPAANPWVSLHRPAAHLLQKLFSALAKPYHPAGHLICLDDIAVAAKCPVETPIHFIRASFPCHQPFGHVKHSVLSSIPYFPTTHASCWSWPLLEI